MAANPEALRIALLTYRGSPYSGGQGVYTRYLAGALTDLGHIVDVYSGPPYPDLDEHVPLVKVSSLDLYRRDDPFRRPARDEFRTPVDALEYALMCTAAFPEPLTFSLRVASALRRISNRYDVVHDNQCLGYGLLAIERMGLPVVATVHHPIPLDRKLDLANAPSFKKKVSLRRWYSFCRMQGRVARRLRGIIAVSEAAGRDTQKKFRVRPDRISVVHNGVDSELFRPLPEVAARPGSIITTASADVPLKGLIYLIEAVAKLNTERDVELVVIGRARSAGAVETAIKRLGIENIVRFENSVEPLRLTRLFAEAEVAVVPSLYEGFSLPAVEAMACAVPLVATTAGALPEVVGPDGQAARLVSPGNPEELVAAVKQVLDDRAMRQRMGDAGRRRALERFTWHRAAEATVDEYRRVLTC
ncbi:MAG: glycosyltransferase family 4 protein [Actinomycetota bacterium]|nr:glycosyltransferase family 4 protein [Actinomycetota bacterium]